MKIAAIIQILEDFAPLALQEEFDNAGLQVGDPRQELTGVLVCLDVTETIVNEAIAKKCNLILSHHPLLFHPLRSVTNVTYTERCVIEAIKNNIVIYSAHTNLDNARNGVNFHLAEKIGLQKIQFLKPSSEGGSGAIGELPVAESETEFLQRIKTIFHVERLTHSDFTGRLIQKAALCGGSGAFLIRDAIAQQADVFITGEAKYNDYHDVENRLLLAVPGHYETEVYTKELFFDIISKKIPNFALHFANSSTNPVKYL